MEKVRVIMNFICNFQYKEQKYFNLISRLIKWRVIIRVEAFKMKKKKILFFLYNLAGGGAERTIINIINNLDQDLFDIVLVIGTNKNNDYGDLINKNIKLVCLNSSRLRFSIFKLRKCILSEKPDLLFSTMNAINIVMLLSKLLTFKKIPVIVREANNRTQSGKVSFINKVLTTFLYNRVATKVISLSEGVKKDLIDNFHVKESNINVIYNPVEVEKIQELSKEKVVDINIEKNEKLIIAVGRLVEQKDHETLIKAFEMVNRVVKSKLIIIGKGPKERELKRLSKNLGVEGNVKFLGFKKNPYKYMRLADVLVLSSKWEGFGHVIVEAMSVGTPVISTNCNSGPGEIIGDDKYGLLVPVGNSKELANKLIELLNNQHKMNHYSHRGMERAKVFHAAKITKQYEKIINQVLKLYIK